MEFLLNAQNFILKSHPSLLPIFVVFLSFVQSWHCALMCGPFIWSKNSQDTNLYLQGRLISYSFFGGIAGYVSTQITTHSEYQTLNILAFLGFFTVSIFILLFWTLSRFIPHHFFKFNLQAYLNKKLKVPSFIQGLLSISIPCPLIFQMLGLAFISTTWFGGAIIGLGHAVATTPALWKSNQWMHFIKTKFGKYQFVIQAIIMLLVMIQVMYYTSKTLYPNEDSTLKLFFCF